MLRAEAAPDGRQYARRHGQGRFEEADRKHEVPGVDGALAPLEEHCRVSKYSYTVLVRTNSSILNMWQLLD